jgi:hypothetical protein
MVGDTGNRRDIGEINILLIPLSILGFIFMSILIITCILIGRQVKKIIISKRTDDEGRLYNNNVGRR